MLHSQVLGLLAENSGRSDGFTFGSELSFSPLAKRNSVVLGTIEVETRCHSKGSSHFYCMCDHALSQCVLELEITFLSVPWTPSTLFYVSILSTGEINTTSAVRELTISGT